MSTARRHLKSPQSLYGTAHPTMVTLVNIMVMNGGLTSFFIQSAQYHIKSPRFHFTSIRPTILEIELFQNLTLKHPRSRSWVRSKVKVTYCNQYQTEALRFSFPINRSNHSWDMAKTVFDLNKKHPKFLTNIYQSNCFRQNFSKI